MSAPQLSVIVLTFNRPKSVLRCLECLEKQTISDFEVIVVNDGSTDDTAALLNNYAPANFLLTVVNKSNEGRSLSRNLGAAKAIADLLVFFDDDMIPHPGCLAAHLSITSPEVISVGTQEEDPSLLENDFDHFRYHIERRWALQLDRAAPQTEPYLTAANFAIYKKAFDKLQGFDDRMQFAEDFDLALRARKHCFRIVYNPGARAWHDNRMGCDTFIRKQIEYYRGRISLQKIYGHSDAGYRPAGLKRILYGIVSWQFLVRLVDAGIFRYLAPRPLRFKFYDFLVTGLSRVYPQRFTMQKIRDHG